MKRLAFLIGGIWLAGAAWGQETNRVTEPTTNAVAAIAPAINAQEQFELGLRSIQERKYASAAEYFQRAVQARPVYPEAYDNWGIALWQMGKQALSPDQQLQSYQHAAEKFSKAAEQSPNDRITQLLWAEVLVSIGDMPVDARLRLGCYQGAVERYRRTAQISPNEWETYSKWGIILSTKLPEFAVDDKARIRLYRDAAELFDRAAKNARFSSEIGPLQANWGSALMRAARLTTDRNDRTKILSDAIEKFEQSARAMPSTAPTYTMWGNALVERGKLSRLRSDYRDGIDRLNTSLSLNANDGATYYGLARAYVVMGNTVMALDTLKKLKEVDPSRAFLIEAARDPDFSDLSREPEFLDLVNPAGGQRRPAYNPPMRDLPH